MEQKILEDSVRYGTPLPPKIENAPELQVGLDLFYIAFMDLTSSRPTGFGEGSIGWDIIDRYCVANDIVEEQREDVFYHISHMDAAYLDFKAKKQAKKSEAESKKTSRKK